MQQTAPVATRPRSDPDTSPSEARRAESAFGWSIVISGIRCALTYVLIPLLGPLAGLSSDIGPEVGLILGAVSAFFIVLSMRRFFRANHRYRWWYAGLGGAVLLLLAVQAAYDIAAL